MILSEQPIGVEAEVEVEVVDVMEYDCEKVKTPGEPAVKPLLIGEAAKRKG